MSERRRLCGMSKRVLWGLTGCFKAGCMASKMLCTKTMKYMRIFVKFEGFTHFVRKMGSFREKQFKSMIDHCSRSVSALGLILP